MHFSTALLTSLLAVSALAGPLSTGNHSSHGQPVICRGLNTSDHGCIRYTRGFDVTGVLTEVDLTFPQVRSECDCIQECLKRPGTCANYVWKFSTKHSVKTGHRTCTLYSDFNLPANVTVEFNLASSNNSHINAGKIIAGGNNPHAGGLVPQAFKDANLNTTADPEAVSGPVWTLANGKVQC